MKYAILNTLKSYLHRTFTAAVVASVLLVSSLPLAAGAQQLSSDKNNPEVKYLGTIDNKLVFQIDLQNASENNYLFVSIKDENGSTLFNEKIRANQFSRKVAFEKEEFEGKKISFVIYNGRESSTQVFQVSRSLRMVEDVAITQVK